ncbi:hypothetical protein ACFO8Q_13495 [Effusibacillus consociatus]|uniref:Uncharacterized protein n=1 Tax=Effusibacillus consociatus TaxID=1117041 RepID=A0ABV9Q370_9BACL
MRHESSTFRSARRQTGNQPALSKNEENQNRQSNSYGTCGHVMPIRCGIEHDAIVCTTKEKIRHAFINKLIIESQNLLMQAFAFCPRVPSPAFTPFLSEFLHFSLFC